MRRALLKVRPYNHSSVWKFVIDMRGFGKRRRFFKSRTSANEELKKQQRLLETHGREALDLSPREMSDFITARDTLAKYDETINEAVQARVHYWEQIRRCRMTVSDLKNEYLAAKEERLALGELKKNHLNDLKSRLNRFCTNFGDCLVVDVTGEQVEKWLLDLKLSTQSRRNYHTVVSGLFNEAVKRRIIEVSPLASIEKPKKSETPPQIFTVDELTKLLESAARVAPNVVPMLAIGAFAGVRTSMVDGEIMRLDWSAIDLKRGHIDMSATVTKRRKRRIIPIQPNLAAWLVPYSAVQGSVVQKNARRKLNTVRKAAGVEWKANALRHSFASYRLEATKNAPLVAYELGHPNPTLLYSTYRELVQPEEAERYWRIAPSPSSRNQSDRVEECWRAVQPLRLDTVSVNL